MDLIEQNSFTLGEGNTALIKSKNIGPAWGLKELFFKLESLNPTGSYKDRFAQRVVSSLIANDINICLATSSGNTGSALAAYCAAGGIKCHIITTDGAPAAKLIQMQLYAAKLWTVAGFGKDQSVTAAVFSNLQKFCSERKMPLPISAYCHHPAGMKGVETIYHEVVNQLKTFPAHIFVPAGGGGLALALTRAAIAADTSDLSTSVHVVQPEGNNSIAGPLAQGLDRAKPVANSTTLISGLQVPSILDGDELIKKSRETGGTGWLVSDRQIMLMQQRLANEEGIFCEPAAACSLAGIAQACEKGLLKPEDKIICLITGAGFKDWNAITSFANPAEPEKIDHTNFSKFLEKL